MSRHRTLYLVRHAATDLEHVWLARQLLLAPGFVSGLRERHCGRIDFVDDVPCVCEFNRSIAP